MESMELGLCTWRTLPQLCPMQGLGHAHLAVAFRAILPIQPIDAAAEMPGLVMSPFHCSFPRDPSCPGPQPVPLPAPAPQQRFHGDTAL